MKPAVEGKVKEIIKVVLEQQISFKNQIKDAILGVVMPILEKIANPIMEPVMSHLLDPIIKAFVQNMKTFSSFLTELGHKDPTGYDKDVKRQIQYADYYWGYMYSSYQELHKLTRSEAMQILSELCSGIYRWRIEDRIEESLKKLQKRALYTFIDDFRKEEQRPDVFAAVHAATLEKMANDTKLIVSDVFCQIVIDGLSPPFKREVVPAIQDIVSPISEAVPEFLKEPPLLDIEGLVEELLMDLLCDCVRGVVRPTAEPRFDAFDRVVAGDA